MNRYLEDIEKLTKMADDLYSQYKNKENSLQYADRISSNEQDDLNSTYNKYSRIQHQLKMLKHQAELSDSELSNKLNQDEDEAYNIEAKRQADKLASIEYRKAEEKRKADQMERWRKEMPDIGNNNNIYRKSKTARYVSAYPNKNPKYDVPNPEYVDWYLVQISYAESASIKQAFKEVLKGKGPTLKWDQYVKRWHIAGYLKKQGVLPLGDLTKYILPMDKNAVAKQWSKDIKNEIENNAEDIRPLTVKIHKTPNPKINPEWM